jgi:hypothetical protein
MRPILRARTPEAGIIRHAIETLRARERSVERSDFPPAPLPSLYIVDGQELTEQQMIDLSRRSS